ncbi:MAG TPA: cupin domain-containing protein [Acidimicrobiales bacterium]
MNAFRPVDLLATEASGDGVAWSAAPEGVNANLVVLGPGAAIGRHRNDEVDVLVVVLDGSVTVTVGGSAHDVPAGSAGVVPRGSDRSIRAGAGGARYLSIHRTRGSIGLRPRPGGQPGGAGRQSG